MSACLSVCLSVCLRVCVFTCADCVAETHCLSPYVIAALRHEISNSIVLSFFVYTCLCIYV